MVQLYPAGSYCWWTFGGRQIFYTLARWRPPSIDCRLRHFAYTLRQASWHVLLILMCTCAHVLIFKRQHQVPWRFGSELEYKWPWCKQCRGRASVAGGHVANDRSAVRPWWHGLCSRYARQVSVCYKWLAQLDWIVCCAVNWTELKWKERKGKERKGKERIDGG